MASPQVKSRHHHAYLASQLVPLDLGADLLVVAIGDLVDRGAVDRGDGEVDEHGDQVALLPSHRRAILVSCPVFLALDT